MDIARPSNAKKKRIKQAIYAGVGLLAVVLVSVGLSRLKPAAPTVERAVVWPAKVKRGPMVRQVRGLGTLTPEDIRWIPATTQGRVEKIILRPGTQVKSGDVILELTNPQLEQQLQDAQLKLRRRRSRARQHQGAVAERPARSSAPRRRTSKPTTTRRRCRRR